MEIFQRAITFGRDPLYYQILVYYFFSTNLHNYPILIALQIKKGNFIIKTNKNKTMKKASLLSLAMILLLASCSVKKRVYMAGYHVEWHKSKNTVAKENSSKHENPSLLVHQKSQTLVQLQNPEMVFENALVSEVAKQQSVNAETKALYTVAKSVNTTPNFAKSSATNVLKKKIVSAGVKSVLKQKLSSSSKSSDDIDIVLLYILCVLIPFVAVGLVTDWEVKDVVINLLLSLLCWIPGIIHAFIKVNENR